MRSAAGILRRLMVYGMVVSLSGLPLVFGQPAPGAGYLAGRIFVADGVTPRAGVVVKAANLSTSEVFTSTSTDGSGRYALTGLPSGRYQVAVQTVEGLYINQDQVPVLKGRKTLFSLALNPAGVQEEPPPPDNPPAQEPPQAEPPAQEPPSANAPEPGEKKPEEEQPEGKKPDEKKPKEKKPEKTPAEEDAGKQGKKKGAGFWRSGWGVAVGLGGGAIVLGLLADSIAGNTNEVAAPPSPSTP